MTAQRGAPHQVLVPTAAGGEGAGVDGQLLEEADGASRLADAALDVGKPCGECLRRPVRADEVIDGHGGARSACAVHLLPEERPTQAEEVEHEVSSELVRAIPQAL